MIALLKSDGHFVEFVKTRDRDDVELVVHGETIYSCKIQELQYGIKLFTISKFLLISMRTASSTIEKSREVSIKTRSPPASLSFNGHATKQVTVKWSNFTTNQ